ncbi:NADH dehydrogenase [ubiquinone] 1 alpha subcomplex assembly factor 8 isoform X1 [Alligator mississippiensis]|uniref:NADH dehydrogenase [ubiquinone] 1 alpha subcomplex assembly factor 8 isoform X1 n=1 Tax=Alligator mississippiensis TaxID=8496 RepID=UPI00287745A9|nr:NADH dehydrogenase [ubiquinone] 1 alpha subcomplex assembly factor 8 isoform X1 [Alligator mississippiensis]
MGVGKGRGFGGKRPALPTPPGPGQQRAVNNRSARPINSPRCAAGPIRMNYGGGRDLAEAGQRLHQSKSKGVLMGGTLGLSNLDRRGGRPNERRARAEAHGKATQHGGALAPSSRAVAAHPRAAGGLPGPGKGSGEVTQVEPRATPRLDL